MDSRSTNARIVDVSHARSGGLDWPEAPGRRSRSSSSSSSSSCLRRSSCRGTRTRRPRTACAVLLLVSTSMAVLRLSSPRHEQWTPVRRAAVAAATLSGPLRHLQRPVKAPIDKRQTCQLGRLEIRATKGKGATRNGSSSSVRADVIAIGLNPFFFLRRSSLKYVTGWLAHYLLRLLIANYNNGSNPSSVRARCLRHISRANQWTRGMLVEATNLTGTNTTALL